MDEIFADMIEIADMALKVSPAVRIAYEAVAWGTHFDLLEQSWEVTKLVHRTNVGLCLDIFHIAARAWGDPENPDGKIPNGDQDLAESMRHLGQDMDLNKLFLLQLSDAERLSGRLVDGDPLYVKGQPSRMTWSRNARLLPCEERFGWHLPILQITKAIVNNLGYRSSVSIETFSKHLREKGAEIPDQMAERAAKSYGEIYRLLEWEKL